MAAHARPSSIRRWRLQGASALALAAAVGVLLPSAGASGVAASASRPALVEDASTGARATQDEPVTPASTALATSDQQAASDQQDAGPVGAAAAPAGSPAEPLTAEADGGADPLAGRTFYGPNPGAAAAAAQLRSSDPQDAVVLTGLAQTPSATWLGAWSGDVTSTVRQVVAAARAVDSVPVFVAYDLPGRDCGGDSAGGSDSAATYARWIQGVADGIGSAEAVVVLEPDALAQLCGDAAARYRLLDSAVDVLEAGAGTHTYLDAGHPDWVDAATMAQRLASAGVADADGFAVNVSNFQTTADDVTYGRAVSTALGGAHFVIDTSRNGNGPGGDWCNPSGRAVGELPTSDTGTALVDAYLWIKTPGESDGTCHGGPSAGTFWTEYALALVRD